MASGNATHSRYGVAGPFPHERLVAYQVGLQLSGWVQGISSRIPRGRSHLRDQLTRASDSVVLNIAEAADIPGKVRLNHFRIAKRSTAECHAAIQLLEIAGLKGSQEGVELAHRLNALLGGLLR